MNKILLLLLFVLTLGATSISAQLFEANFDDGTLNGMTTIDNDGLTLHPNVAAIGGAFSSFSITNDDFDTPFAASASWFANGALTADDYLITPELDITTADYFFKFDARAVDASYADGYEVLVSTTDAEPASFTDQLFSTAAESADKWESRFFSLADYEGQKIYVAIRNNSTDKFILAIDNVEVLEVTGREVTALGFQNNRWNLSGVDINMTLRNAGAETITSMTVNYKIGDGTEITEEITDLDFAPFTETVISLDSPIEGVDEFDVEYTITSINGEADDLSDNTASMTINTQAEAAVTRAVVEEGTGTWCGWCPRGHVFMELMAEEYPEDFIGIAAHNSDPMVVTEHDDGLGFTGFPNAIMNRQIEMDPSQIEGFLDVSGARIVPLSVNASLTYDESTREAIITADAISSVNATNTDFKFSIIMTEDEVVGTTANYDQVNFYAGGAAGVMGGYESLANPVPAADMVYNDVSRAILGGYNGADETIPSSLTEGETYSVSFNYTVPDAYNPMHMQAVVLIIDGTDGSIINATEVIVQMPVNTFETETLEDVTLYPNPTSDLVNVELGLESVTDVTVSLTDFSGKMIFNNTYTDQSNTVTLPINLDNVVNGIYLVRIETNEGSTVKRLVISK